MRLPRTPPPVRLSPGVWRIPLVPGHAVNAYAFVEDDETITLVDTGVPWTADVLTAGLTAIGSGPEKVGRVVLTHAHSDHAGGAAAMVALARPGTTVHAHERDVDYLRRGVPPMGDLATRLGRAAQRMPWAKFPRIADAVPFPPGVLLPVAGGLQTYPTPGHTPGHVSLLHASSGLLITGDALFNIREIRWPMAAFCTDPTLNRRSADILGDLDYDLVAFIHGPEIRTDARGAVRAFLRGHSSDDVRGPRRRSAR